MNRNTAVRALYKKLLTLYPRGFREQLGDSMEQTFEDIYRERKQRTIFDLFGFVTWTFVETLMGIVKEYVLLITKGVLMNNSMANPRSAALISSILLAVTFIVAPLIYLMGNLRDAFGPLSYDVADFLYGPVWAASLITVVFILRERMGEQAPRRMSLALLAAVLAAGITVTVALIRSANRHYHLIHPELHLESSSDVLVVWTTLVAGLTNTAWHFLGWAMVLIGSAGWTSRYIPRLLSGLYLVAGVISLFVYLLPGGEQIAVMLGVVVSIWQGILLSKAEPGETKAPELIARQS